MTKNSDLHAVLAGDRVDKNGHERSRDVSGGWIQGRVHWQFAHEGPSRLTRSRARAA